MCLMCRAGEAARPIGGVLPTEGAGFTPGAVWLSWCVCVGGGERSVTVGAVNQAELQ